jgi:probable rRNA maturation factor
MIDSDQSRSRIPIDPVGLRRFLLRAQRAAGVTGEVNVLITSNREMQRLNRDFRGKDRPTDVLSFPAPQNGHSSLAGDIAISAAIARSNARRLGHPFNTELKILLLHGLLHLAGHDHESDRGQMAAIEQRLRCKLGLPPSLTERNQRTTVSTAGDSRRLHAPAAGASGGGSRRTEDRRSQASGIFRRIGAAGKGMAAPPTTTGGIERNEIDRGRNHIKQINARNGKRTR